MTISPLLLELSRRTTIEIQRNREKHDGHPPTNSRLTHISYTQREGDRDRAKGSRMAISPPLVDLSKGQTQGGERERVEDRERERGCPSPPIYVSKGQIEREEDRDREGD